MGHRLTRRGGAGTYDHKNESHQAALTELNVESAALKEYKEASSKRIDKVESDATEIRAKAEENATAFKDFLARTLWAAQSGLGIGVSANSHPPLILPIAPYLRAAS